MGLFNKIKSGGLMDQIRCDEPSYLIWKWHPKGTVAGNNTRENAIRWGSSLRVKDGEVAVFIYDQGNGIMQDFIEGPYDMPIETNNFPVLANLIGKLYDGGTPFQAEVYFINLANIIQTRFAVPYFDVYDPRFDDFCVPVAVRGTISYRIRDYREFISLHRLVDFNQEDFQKQIRDAVIRYAKDTVVNAPAQHNIPVVQLEAKTSQINDIIEYDIGKRLGESFGVEVYGVDLSAIEIDKSSDEYRQLMSVTRDISSVTAKAEAEAKIKDIHAKQRIEAENYEETLRIQREEAQYAQHKATQSSNMGAFQVEKQAEVGIAGAEALGHMGENGAGNIDLGNNNAGGINMASIMASMAIGGAVGQNIAGTMNGMMSGVNSSPVTSTTPPPIPGSQYHVAINGEAVGPFSIATLTQMAANGSVTLDTLVWKSGMDDWKSVGSVEELKNIFGNIPPIPKKQ